MRSIFTVKWNNKLTITYMNNKQFLSELSDKCQMGADQSARQVEVLLGVMEKIWQDGDSVSLSGFGVLEVKKKNERISVNPTTGVRMLVPPKLVLTYKPSSLLAERLSQEGGMSKAAAEQFVKNFFDIISQRVLSEGLVKVKGLGTFKLLQMEDRESVNVNTGERFTIDGHQKISFVPDADLKERINKPFAAFETVVITEEQAAQLAGMDTETENAPAQEPAAKPAKAEKAKAAAKEDTQEPQVKDVTQKKGTRCLLKIILWIVITILVIGLGLFMLWPVIGNNVLEVLERDYLDRNKTEMVADSVKTAAPVQKVAPVKEAAPEKPAAQPAAKPAQQPAAKPAETPAAKPAAKPAAQPAAQPAQKYPTIQLNSKDQAKDLSEFTMDDVNNFSMEGVLATHTLAKGETITRVALKYYGSKKLWPYIVKYNNIKDPTKLHEGTVIKVPVLKAK